MRKKIKFAPKYKEGDKVRVRSDLELCRKYYSDDGKTSAKVTSDMLRLRGKVVTIFSHDKNLYGIREGGYYKEWVDGMFEPITTSKIVITTDGDETTADFYDGNRIVDSATVVVCSKNEFNFKEDAILALMRLAGLDHTPSGECIHETDIKNENKMLKIIKLLQEANLIIGELTKAKEGTTTDEKDA